MLAANYSLELAAAAHEQLRRALQVLCLGGLRSTRLLLLDPPEWMPLCRVVAWGGCARSGVSR